MRWPRDGKPAPDSGPPLLDRIDALRRGASEPEWEVPDVLPWLFGAAALVIFAGLVMVGYALQG